MASAGPWNEALGGTAPLDMVGPGTVTDLNTRAHHTSILLGMAPAGLVGDSGLQGDTALRNQMNPTSGSRAASGVTPSFSSGTPREANLSANQPLRLSTRGGCRDYGAEEQDTVLHFLQAFFCGRRGGCITSHDVRT